MIVRGPARAKHYEAWLPGQAKRPCHDLEAVAAIMVEAHDAGRQMRAVARVSLTRTRQLTDSEARDVAMIAAATIATR